MCVFSTCIIFFKQKTAYEMRISDWSSDVCSSDLRPCPAQTPHDQKKAARRQRLHWSRFLHVERISSLSGCLRRQGRPIGPASCFFAPPRWTGMKKFARRLLIVQIGRASCRERVCQYVDISVVAVSLKKKSTSTYISYNVVAVVLLYT